MTTEQSGGACTPSFSSDGLDVTAAMMTNTELADAIAYAFDRCDQRYVGGYTTGTTEAGKAMLEHLRELLAIQRTRAGMMKTSNDRVEGRDAASSRRVPSHDGLEG